MAVVNYSFARQNLAKLMDEVEQDCAPIFITRQRKRGGAVLVSQAEWDSIQETLYLVRTPKDAQDLRDAIAELNAGKGIEHAPLNPPNARRAPRGSGAREDYLGVSGARRLSLFSGVRAKRRPEDQRAHRGHPSQPVFRNRQARTVAGRIVRVLVTPHHQETSSGVSRRRSPRQNQRLNKAPAHY